MGVESLVLGELAQRGPVLAVVAHPDDESFGLGAVIAALHVEGADIRVLCLTRGEASTLGASADLGVVRLLELRAAAGVLGVSEVVLEDFADGGLSGVPVATIDDVLNAQLRDAVTLLVFDVSGVTGHPDHRAASAAALRVARRHHLDVLEWGVTPQVASQLNIELATSFVALAGDGVTDIVVDRTVQLAAIACHQSQAHDNPVLTRRLELQGTLERVRLHPADRVQGTG
ncbi:PIG-L family deacetylase (plasmid) [Rhodococcus antarcticus]|uniref:PIG-L family deacetylase n=1 Tax=Rhodococcus antarcticus TaxID=2987751 RepID=A0ABY6P5S9_9NOCA|nr:PIG-L deacetylase family protein [Rhodococcus antarcticus]UZJ27030.1 PIG-L family deacetylase [Rhodococcus antarcticus]